MSNKTPDTLASKESLMPRGARLEKLLREIAAEVPHTGCRAASAVGDRTDALLTVAGVDKAEKTAENVTLRQINTETFYAVKTALGETTDLRSLHNFDWEVLGALMEAGAFDPNRTEPVSSAILATVIRKLVADSTAETAPTSPSHAADCLLAMQKIGISEAVVVAAYNAMRARKPPRKVVLRTFKIEDLGPTDTED